MPELIGSTNSFESVIKTKLLSVMHFCADWVEQCGQVNDVLDTLAKEPEFSNAKFCKCQAEDLSEVSLKYKIEAVPTVLYFRSGSLLDRVDGADVSKITAKVKQHYQSDIVGEVEEKKVTKREAPLEDRLHELLSKERIMVFMKGDRNTPRCGFSRQLITILNELGAEYETFDILSDEEVRQGLKTYSDWPTYPQLYLDAELLGGLDIIKEMNTTGELRQILIERR